MRSYVMVVEEDGRKVVEVYESEEMTFDNVRKLSKGVSECWRGCAEKYRAPIHDVLWAHADNLKELKEMFPEMYGWEEAKVRQIKQ